ncbi:MAG: ABC transporter permease subunit, partial [Gemmatimonadetes bacterium]|nr:ABC transporter permease subunit [Gemmatimonadota bacterium]
MLAAIVKRELIDYLISLRFGLALVLTVGLMVLNALGFVGGSYEFRRDHYLQQVQAEQEIGRSDAQRGLWKLILHSGQEHIYKKPSALMFCATGANDALPERLWTQSFESTYGSTTFYDPFVLIYWDIIDIWAPKANQLLETQNIDWVFIIGGLLSLMALLFTFDAFIGEKERGTLKLVMAQSLPRHTLLLGKFLGAMLALAIMLSLAIVVNLLIVLALSQVNLGLVEASRLVGMVGLSLLYLACFVSLGLWVSIRSSTTRSSLVGVLLLWTCGV